MPKRRTLSNGSRKIVWKSVPNGLAEESFRTIQVGSHRVILACPKSETDAGHCNVAAKIEAVLHDARPQHSDGE